MIFYAKATEKEVIAKLVFSNKLELSKFLIADQEKGYKGSYVVTVEKEKRKRSPEQNSALHVFYKLLADSFNEAGLTVKKVLEQKIDLDWNEKLVKELLWRPAQEAITGKNSTTELDKASEINVVYEHLNRHIGEKFGVHVPFPTKTKEEFKVDVAYPENNLGEQVL